MTLPRFEYQSPGSLEEAVNLLREYGDDAMLIAGGLNTVLLLRERLIKPGIVIDLASISNLREIKVDKVLTIGAMSTYTQITNSEIVHSEAPLVSEACGHVGSPAIRNMGTLGGNVCQGDSASDSAPALLAMDAEAVLYGPDGERTISLNDFFYGVFTTALEENEILTKLRIPKPKPGTIVRYKKFTCRSEEAYSTVTVALNLLLDKKGKCKDIRIGLGSVAPVPMRATDAENLLKNQILTNELIAEAAANAAAATDPPSDGQASSEYRRKMTEVWVRRLLEDTGALHS